MRSITTVESSVRVMVVAVLRRASESWRCSRSAANSRAFWSAVAAWLAKEYRLPSPATAL